MSSHSIYLTIGKKLYLELKFYMLHAILVKAITQLAHQALMKTVVDCYKTASETAL